MVPKVLVLTLSGPGFEKLAQTGGGAESAPLYPNQTKFGVGKYNHMTSPCAKCQVFWLKNDVIMTQ